MCGVADVEPSQAAYRWIPGHLGLQTTPVVFIGVSNRGGAVDAVSTFYLVAKRVVGMRDGIALGIGGRLHPSGAVVGSDRGAVLGAVRHAVNQGGERRGDQATSQVCEVCLHDFTSVTRGAIKLVQGVVMA